MPVPLPDTTTLGQDPPDAAEAQHIARGIVAAATGTDGLTELQRALIQSIALSMTGYAVTVDVRAIDPEAFAVGLAHRDAGFRVRILQLMILTALVVRPLPDTVAARLDDFSAALSVGDGMLDVVHDFAAAQHDWVHVLADYGTCVESELEVFAFIARANDDPRGFGLLAMVVSLFETGALAQGAGLLEAFPGQLSHTGVAVRLADAMRCGAVVPGGVDFLDVDWFDVAPLTVDEARDHFGVAAKHESAIVAGSIGPWEPGGISEFQLHQGREHAEARGEVYDSFGACLRPSR